MILRDYQQASIDALYRYFGEQTGNPLVVLPTGSGKSVVIAAFIKGIFDQYPGQRVLCLTHVKELIEQNHERMVDLWPDAPAGIYSASLNRRDTFDPIIFAGIQSVHKRANELGAFDLVLIDECHLINIKNDGMYRTFLDALQAINPTMKCIGLTATAFRTSSGDITYGDQRIFTDVAYELPISILLEAGHLASLVSKRTAAEIDVSGVHVRQGEFVHKELEAAVERDGLTDSAVNEIITYGENRRSWLIFCTGVNHAHHVKDALVARGIKCECVTGKTKKDERARIIADYKTGRIKAITNANVLTTGFDAPETDLIAFLRPTISPGLYVQMAGRGMRTAPGKENCLVLDFAGNVARHGPVDHVKAWVPAKRGKTPAPAPVKYCPECDSILPAQAIKCPDCGFLFPVKPRHQATASSLSILSGEPDPVVTVAVDSVQYSKHEKPGKPPSLRVDYQCGLRRFSEWICLEHSGYAQKKAVAWWTNRTGREAPATVDDALLQIKALPTPSKITVNEKQKYPEITDYEFNAISESKPNRGSRDSTAGPERHANRYAMR